MTSGEKLKKARKAKKQSQQEAAKAIGVHLNTYSKLERGISKPSPQTAKKLAAIYGKDENYFMDDTEGKTIESPKASALEKNVADMEHKTADKETKPSAVTGSKPKQSATKAKKNPVKKSSSKKPAAKTVKKVKPVSAKVESVVSEGTDVRSTAIPNIELQYAGKTITYNDLISRVKQIVGDIDKELRLYIKPEENRVYYTIDNIPGSFEI